MLKKTTILTLVLTMLITCVNAQDDKAFHKGSITIDPSIGFAIYGTKVHAEFDEDYWTGSGIGKRRVVEDTTDGAGATVCG